MSENGTTKDALVLVGRAAADARTVLESHAERLRRRGVADSVHVVEYDRDHRVEATETLAAVDAATAYVVPMVIDRTHVPTATIRDALAGHGVDVHLCQPVGKASAVTSILVERAQQHTDRIAETTLLVVGLGRSSDASAELPAETHAARIREATDYDQVLTGYLLQSPAVECLRYEVTNEEVVAVPLFVAGGEATDERIPELLAGDVACTEPLGTHPWLTDAVVAELARSRVLTDEESVTVSAALETTAPIVTDGKGPSADPSGP